jgi:hypothetical protein
LRLAAAFHGRVVADADSDEIVTVEFDNYDDALGAANAVDAGFLLGAKKH